MLTLFRWRHAIPLSLENLTPIIRRQADTLQELEISMLQPPSAHAVNRFQRQISEKKLPNLRSFKYYGLSHTEPLPVNRPERGGRFRMLRPLFQKIHTTLQELVLTQDHCISQVGKTPMTLGRTIFDAHCRLDDLYVDPSRTTIDEPPVSLTLTNLELGGFNVDNLFDGSGSDIAVPRVRIHLSALRRLVLNSCFGLDTLLSKLLARKDEIKLTEFAVRIGDEDGLSSDLSPTFQSLRDFLLCFKGLEVLSVLVEASAGGLRIGKDVLTHHASTLRAYSVASRDNEDGDDDETTLRFVSIPDDGLTSKDEISPGCLGVPVGLREYGTFLNKIVGGEYARLRHLSQFPDLKSVVVRNFPALPPTLRGMGKDNTIQQFWRSPRDSYDYSAILKVVETFAEQIALPFYALPESYYAPTSTVVNPCLTEEDFARLDAATEDQRIVAELEEIVAAHTTARNKILGFNLKSPPSSPTPKMDLTRDVLKQKAEADPGFKEVKQKVEDGTASLYESHAFENYQALVQVALGVKSPPPESKPKLSLLVIGDWTYRDQMNLCGPRRWDPTAWSHGSPEEATDNILSDNDSDDEENSGTDRWNHKTYQLRAGFRKEFDISLLPVFFSVDWVVLFDKKKGRFRWSPKATRLERDTLEGLEALGNTKLLEYAWLC